MTSLRNGPELVDQPRVYSGRWEHVPFAKKMLFRVPQFPMSMSRYRLGFKVGHYHRRILVEVVHD